jgi:hypothetical protein
MVGEGGTDVTNSEIKGGDKNFSREFAKLNDVR